MGEVSDRYRRLAAIRSSMRLLHVVSGLIVELAAVRAYGITGAWVVITGSNLSP